MTEFKIPNLKFPRTIKIPTLKIKKIAIKLSKYSSREPLKSKIKKKVKERAKNKCEQRNCNKKQFLEFHHINMKNSDDKEKNIQLLCVHHHKLKHSKMFRKKYKDIYGVYYTRLVKKIKKKTTKKKSKKKDMLGIPKFKPIKW